MPADDTIRNRVLDALSLIASADLLAAARPDLAPGRVNFLLCSMWFDEVYQAGTRYMDSLKGDFNADVAGEFLDSFDEDETRWLERFNRFLELRVDRLSATDRAARAFPPGERWGNVMRDAGHLVDLLGGNPRRSRVLDSEIASLLTEK